MSAAPTIRPLLRQSDVIAILKVSRPTLWHWRREGRFPAPIKIGPNTIAWTPESIEAWLAERPGA